MHESSGDVIGSACRVDVCFDFRGWMRCRPFAPMARHRKHEGTADFDIRGPCKSGRVLRCVSAPPPELPSDADVDFTRPGTVAYGAGYGWLPPTGWGSWAIGPAAAMEFHAPAGLCRTGAALKMRVDPYLPPSRPALDVDVRVNGRPVTTWHFNADGKFSSNTTGDSDYHQTIEVEATLGTGGTCAARVQLRFARPAGSSPPYPDAEGPRPLQLRVLGARVVPRGQ